MRGILVYQEHTVSPLTTQLTMSGLAFNVKTVH